MREAALRQVPLTVLAVHPVALSAWTRAPISYPQDKTDEENARAAAQDSADKAAGQLSGAHPPSVTVRSVSGSPAEELVKAAQDADMLVVGARGEGGFGHLRLGSVSNQVVHHAAVPVVVIPGTGES